MLDQRSLTVSEQDRLKATYAPKLLDEDKTVRWAEEVRAVHDLVRALSPGIGARAFHPSFDGPVKIWRTRVEDGSTTDRSPGAVSSSNGRISVRCGVGALEVLELQAPGGRRMTAREFLLGRTLDSAFVS